MIYPQAKKNPNTNSVPSQLITQQVGYIMKSRSAK